MDTQEKLYPIKELAKKHGQLLAVPVQEDGDAYKAEHLAAAYVHGWNLHKHNTGEDVQLTEADYLAALEAAKLVKAHPAADKRKPADALPEMPIDEPKKKGSK